MDKKEAKEYLKRKKPILEKLRGNARAIDQYRKLYNTLCQECKKKLLKQPNMPVENYCEACQNKIAYRMKRIREMI